MLPEKIDSPGFYMYQTTKVRVSSFLDEGIEVSTRSYDKRWGFIPYCYLNRTNLYVGKSVYVIYLGQDENNILFGEEGTFHEKPAQDILEYNKLWIHEQKILEKYKRKVISNFNNIYVDANERSIELLKELLINYEPMDVANAISKVACSYTADLGFINMVKDSLGLKN